MLIALGSPSVNPNWESNPRYVTATGLELEHFSLSSKKFSLLHIFKKFQILTVFKILDVWNIDFVFDFKRIFDVYGKFWLLMQDIQIHSSAVLSVRPRETSKSSLYYVLQMLKKELPSVMIKVHQLQASGLFHAVLKLSKLLFWFLNDYWRLRYEFSREKKIKQTKIEVVCTDHTNWIYDSTCTCI